MMLERRKHKRIPIYPLSVKFFNEGKEFAGFITDLSEGGTNLWTKYKLKNDDFDIRIKSINKIEFFLSLKAQRVWEDKIFESGCFVIGCQFKELILTQRKQILELMMTLSKEFREQHYYSLLSNQFPFVNVNIA